MHIPYNIKIRVRESAHKKFESRRPARESRSITRKVVEGAGAGYTVTITDLEITEEPKIEYSANTGSFVVTTPVEYVADAEGYDWSVSAVNAEAGGGPRTASNPYIGDLIFKIKDSPEIWKDVDPAYFEDEDKPTRAEKIEALQGYFYKGRTFGDFHESYGGGWSHVSYPDSVGVCFPSDDFTNRFSEDLVFDRDLEFESGGYNVNYADSIGGALTMDSDFLQDIEFAREYAIYGPEEDDEYEVSDESRRPIRESRSIPQRVLKRMAADGDAIDITDKIDAAYARELRKKGVRAIDVSYGTYGMNGALLLDNDGNQYVITARSPSLFYFV